MQASVYAYFAYGSNMNPARVAARGLEVRDALPARYVDRELVFDKSSAAHPGSGHANLRWRRGAVAEGVFYELADDRQILLMDPFESAPVNYSRELVEVQTPRGRRWAWTYFANAAVRRPGLRPSRGYLDHLLAGRPFLSAPYYRRLAAWPCSDQSP